MIPAHLKKCASLTKFNCFSNKFSRETYTGTDTHTLKASDKNPLETLTDLTTAKSKKQKASNFSAQLLKRAP